MASCFVISVCTLSIHSKGLNSAGYVLNRTTNFTMGNGIFYPNLVIGEISSTSSSTSSLNISPENRECMDTLKSIRLSNLHNVVIGHLNVNSFSEKFDSIKTMLPGNIDIMIFSETKIDESHPTSQFMIGGFLTPYRFDRNRFGGGILI